MVDIKKRDKEIMESRRGKWSFYPDIPQPIKEKPMPAVNNSDVIVDRQLYNYPCDGCGKAQANPMLSELIRIVLCEICKDKNKSKELNRCQQ